MKNACLLFGLPALLLLTGPARADPAYLERFAGSFSGSGTILRDVDPEPRQVSCRLTGRQSSAEQLSIGGTCRAAVIFTRQIGADITYNSGSDTFSGVYTGSQTGPAQLSGGRLNGDTLSMTITYAKPTYGDRQATMTIVNAGSAFTMVVTDQVDGRATQTSSVQLSRR